MECWVNFPHVGDVGGTGWMLPLTMVSTARTMLPMPSVAMNELTFSLTTTKPLTAPIATPARIDNTMASAIDMWCATWRLMARMALRLAVEPMERS